MVDDVDDIPEEKPVDPNVIQPGALAPGAAPGKLISEVAKAALFEAAERRKAQETALSDRPDEHSGPKGAEPTRFGDWERSGIAYDF